MQAQSISEILDQTLNFSQSALINVLPNAINTLSDQISMNDQIIINASTSGVDESSFTCRSSSGVSMCSQHGICDLNSQKCKCSSGYYYVDCSMNETAYNQQLSYREKLIEYASAAYTPIKTDIYSEEPNMAGLLSILTLLNAVTEEPYLNSNKTLSTVYTFLDDIINFMQSMDVTTTSISAHIQQAAEVISNVLNQVTVTDCGVSTEFSSQAINNSYSMIGELSDLSLKDYNPTNAPETVRTDLFVLYSTLIDSSNLSGLTVAPDSNAPQVKFGAVNNSASPNLPDTLALSYIYLKKDPTSCIDTPPTNFTLEIKDGKTFQPVKVVVPIQVTYPRDIFKNDICPSSTGCEKSADSSGNTVCSCEDISIFDVGSQLANIYRNSQLNKLNLENFKKIFTTAIFSKWSFWAAVICTGWLATTWAIVLTCNKHYCIIKRLRAAALREKIAKNPSKNRLSLSYKSLLILFATHPLMSIFMIIDPRISKAFRALLYYLRVMIVLGYSAIFARKDQPVSFTL